LNGLQKHRFVRGPFFIFHIHYVIQPTFVLFRTKPGMTALQKEYESNKTLNNTIPKNVSPIILSETEVNAFKSLLKQEDLLIRGIKHLGHEMDNLDGQTKVIASLIERTIDNMIREIKQYEPKMLRKIEDLAVSKRFNIDVELKSLNQYGQKIEQVVSNCPKLQIVSTPVSVIVIRT